MDTEAAGFVARRSGRRALLSASKAYRKERLERQLVRMPV